MFAHGSDGQSWWSSQVLTWRGNWNSATAYNANDVVNYGGSSYLALAASTNKPPAANTKLGAVSAASTCYYAWIGGGRTTIALKTGQAALISGSSTVFNIAGSAVKIALGICAVPAGASGSGMTAVGGGVDAAIPPNPNEYVSVPFSLTRVVKASDLGGAGSYDVGLCFRNNAGTLGQSDEANVTTLIYKLGG